MIKWNLVLTRNKVAELKNVKCTCHCLLLKLNHPSGFTLSDCDGGTGATGAVHQHLLRAIRDRRSLCIKKHWHFCATRVSRRWLQSLATTRSRTSSEYSHLLRRVGDRMASVTSILRDWIPVCMYFFVYAYSINVLAGPSPRTYRIMILVALRNVSNWKDIVLFELVFVG
jgi:hypothetical protein